MIDALKTAGINDEMIAEQLNKHADIAQTYAADIEKGCMHLNKGFTNWTPTN